MTNFLKKAAYLICGFAFLILFSCSGKQEKKNIPELDNIDIGEIAFIRYDKEIAGLDTENIKAAYEKLLLKYPVITDLYFKRLLGIKHEDQDSFYVNIVKFLKAAEIVMLQDTIDHVFPSTEEIEKDFVNAFQFMKYYFPDFGIPNVYFLQTEFGYQNIIFTDTDKDGIGVGLDMYLGNEFDYKSLDARNPSFSAYLSRTYNEDHMVRKSISMLLDDILGVANGKRFLDLIIHNGKKLYILEQLMPYEQDTIIAEFSSTQLDWLRNNELEVWSYFMEHDLIYESNHLKIDKYVNPSPHSPGMPIEAPGRTGSYIGWRIVQSYMTRYPETSLAELVQLNDSQKLMELSKYKPKRR